MAKDQKKKITIEDILAGTVSEQDILLEEQDNIDHRSKREIYRLDVYDEARQLNAMPEFKMKLYNKRDRLYSLVKRQGELVHDLFADLKSKNGHEDYTVICEFLTFFHPQIEKLARLTNHFLAISNVLNVAEDIGKSKKHNLPRIDLDSIRQKSLEAAEALGLDLRKHGSVYQCLCPFHQEKTPSFTLYPNSHYFVCFGCGEKMGTIDLVMKMKGWDFFETVKFLERL